MRLTPFVGVSLGEHPKLVTPFVAFLHVPRGVGCGLKIKHLASAIRAST
jgi:hypothetical protein